MTFTDEQMDEYSQWAASAEEPTFTPEPEETDPLADMAIEARNAAIDEHNAEEALEAHERETMFNTF